MTPRFHRVGAALLSFAVLAASGPVHSSPLDYPADAQETQDYSSSQHFALELKLGPYAPHIDAEFDGAATPFGDLFGSGTRMMFQFEFDYQFLRAFGSLGVGLAAGFYQARAAPFADDGADATGDSPGQPSSGLERTAGSTSLRLIPLSLLLVYRFDYVADRWGIPLVPFIKGGVNHTFWRVSAPDGSTATAAGQKGEGGTWGWQLNAGLAFRLGFLEPSAAKAMDVESGVNHTYLFVELIHLQADNFGSANAFSVGDTTFCGGLAFEF